MKKGKAVNEAYKGVVDLIGNGGIYFNVIFFFVCNSIMMYQQSLRPGS